MEWSFVFFLNSALLGVGLAMDAFSVSLANGLHDPYMSRRRGAIIAGTFGVFQAVMPPGRTAAAHPQLSHRQGHIVRDDQHMVGRHLEKTGRLPTDSPERFI